MSFTDIVVVSADVVGDGCDVLSAQPLGLVGAVVWSVKVRKNRPRSEE